MVANAQQTTERIISRVGGQPEPLVAIPLYRYWELLRRETLFKEIMKYHQEKHECLGGAGD